MVYRHLPAIDYARPNFTTTALESKYRRLARAACSLVLALALVFVFLQAAHERFVNFNRTIAEQSAVLFHRLANSVIHEPCCLLRDANVFGELHRRNALAGSR